MESTLGCRKAEAKDVSKAGRCFVTIMKAFGGFYVIVSDLVAETKALVERNQEPLSTWRYGVETYLGGKVSSPTPALSRWCWMSALTRTDYSGCKAHMYIPSSFI